MTGPCGTCLTYLGTRIMVCGRKWSCVVVVIYYIAIGINKGNAQTVERRADAAYDVADAVALLQVVKNTGIVHLQFGVEQLSLELLLSPVLKYHEYACRYPAYQQHNYKYARVKRNFNPGSHNRSPNG